MSDMHPSLRVSRATAAAVAGLASAALINRGLAERAEDRHPPIGRLLDIAGTQLHVVERGAGPPLVLIHGNGSLVQDFLSSGIVARLARQYRVILIDRPGYGHSTRPTDRSWTPEAQADLFAAACLRLGVERPLLVGHSFGVLPALAWALHPRAKIAGLVLMSGFMLPQFRLDSSSQKLLVVPGVRGALTNTLLPIQARITGPIGNKMLFSPGKVTPGYKRGMPFELMLRPGQIAATLDDGAQMVATTKRLAPRYPALDLPTLLIWGAGDKLVNGDKQSARMLDILPNAEGWEIGETGHMVHHTHPGPVASRIARFAAKALRQ